MININKKYMDKNEWLKFLQVLHNKVRSAKGIKLTGLPALNEISNFLMFKFIEKYVKKEKLPKTCNFSYLYESYATDEKIKADNKIPINENKNSFKLWNIVYNAKNKDCMLVQLIHNDFFKKYLKSSVSGISAFTERPQTSELIQQIFNIVYKTFENVNINYDFYDAFGSAYEQFKTDSVSNTGKHTGQHFTPTSIKIFIINELKPQSNELFYEPCCGSGGFIHTTFSYIHNNDSKNEKQFKQNIYANECNPEIIKPLMINMLLHDIPITHIKEQDSLDMSLNCTIYKDKFDVIATNPPFGMNTELKDDEYWNPIKSGKTVVKNSTAQFLLHIYHSLKIGGRAGIVIDRGILNNGSEQKNWQYKFRKWLLENVNVTKIVLLPTGIFDYTKFATALIFFSKGSKTKKIEYFNGEFKEGTKDLYVSDKPFKTINFEQIKNNNYDLNTNIEVTEKLTEKIEWIKLTDVIKLEKKQKKYKASDGNEKGKYEFYTCGEKILYRDDYEFEQEKILINGGGKANIRIAKKFSTSNDVHILDCKKDYLNKFIYYYFKLSIHILEKNMHGNGLKHLIQSDLLDIDIPKLTIEFQKKIIVFLDRVFENNNMNLLSEKIKNTDVFKLLIYDQFDVFNIILDLASTIESLEEKNEQFKKYNQKLFMGMLFVNDYEEKKLGDLIDVKCGSKMNLQNYLTDKSKHFIVRTRNFDNNEDKLFINDEGYKLCKNSLIQKNDIMMSSFINPFNCSMACDSWIGQTYNGGIFRIRIVEKKIINVDYLLYYFKFGNFVSQLNEFKKGGIVDMFNIASLNQINICVPSLETQQYITDQINKNKNTEEEYKNYLKRATEQFNVIINNISKYIKKINEANINEKKCYSKPNESDGSDVESVDEKPKKTQNKTSKKQIKKNNLESDTDSVSSNSSNDSVRSIEVKPKKSKSLKKK